MQEELFDPKTKKILIVDDDDSIQDLLKFTLAREGFNVETANDGLEAVKKIQSAAPDLLLLDLMLPKRGGFEVLRSLQMEGTAHIPVVVITGRYTDRTTSEMIRQEPNVVDFLEKPVKPSVLTAQVHRLLRTKPKAVEVAEQKSKEMP